MHFVSFAQQRDVEHIFLPYSNFTIGTAASPKLTRANKFFIARLRKEDLAANKKSAGFTVLRQLTNTVFILKIIDTAQNLFTFPLLPANNNWKLSPTLMDELSTNKQNLPAVFLVAVYDDKSFLQWGKKHTISFSKTTALQTYSVKINTVKELDELISSAPINYISRYNTQPQQELQINSLDLSTNKINLLHSKLPALSGNTDYMDRSFSCGGSYSNEGASTVGAILIPGTPSGPDSGSWMLACTGPTNPRTFNANDVVGLNYLYK